MKTKQKTFTVIAIVIMMSCFLCLREAWARGGAGGGEVAHFDAGQWAESQVVGLGSSMLGSAISSEIFPETMGYTSGAPDFGTALSGGAGNWMNNYSTGFAGGEVNRAVYMYGQYKGWTPEETAWRSAAISGVTSGVLSSFDMTGLEAGLAKGAVQGGLTYLAVDDKGKVDPWVGAGINIAGDFAANVPRSYETTETKQLDSNGNVVTVTQQGPDMFVSTAFNVPGELVQAGVEQYAEEHDLTNDQKYMLEQAVSGLEILTGAFAAASTAELEGVTGKRRQVDLTKTTTRNANIPNARIPVTPSR